MWGEIIEVSGKAPIDFSGAKISSWCQYKNLRIYPLPVKQIPIVLTLMEHCMLLIKDENNSMQN